MNFSSGALVSFLVAISFSAGLNIYATTTTLGLLARVHWVHLPPGLALLAHTWVIALGGALFLCEVFADKIPYFDLLWNLTHTFVRVPLAALMAYRATNTLSPQVQALVVVMSAAIAAVSHGTKSAARTPVSTTPEPVSNIALSSAEDMGAIGLTWLATRHPVAAAFSTLAAILLGVWVVVKLWQNMRRRGLRLKSWWDARLFSPLPRNSTIKLGTGEQH